MEMVTNMEIVMSKTMSALQVEEIRGVFKTPAVLRALILAALLAHVTFVFNNILFRTFWDIKTHNECHSKSTRD